MAEVVTPDVQIPGKAVSAGEDVREPVRDLLEDLYLLGSKDEMEKAGNFTAAVTGPPQSVAVIEAGATAAAKWWATLLGAGAAATWVSVVAWWDDQAAIVQAVVIGGAAFVTAAVAVAIGYLLAQDVRSRAAAAVATIEARAQVATRMIEAAEDVYTPAPTESEVQLIPLPAGLKVKNLRKGGDEKERGWLAVAIERQADGKRKYVLVKGSDEEIVDVSEVQFAE